MLSKSQIKYIQSLGQKKFRDAGDVFIAEGPKIAEEFLTDTTQQIEAIYVLEELLQVYARKYPRHAFTGISTMELERISQLKTPNEILLVLRKPHATDPLALNGKLSLMLDTIQDPGNMGTILRIADWFGVSQLLCSPDTVDIYNPKVVQSAMGSLGRVPVYYTDLSILLERNPGLRVYAAVLEGVPVATVGKLREGVVLIGNESGGIRPELLQKANVRITIPRRGKAESLNAAVAAGILLSHLSGT